MSDSYKKLFQGYISNAAGVLYTAGTTFGTIVKNMKIVNVTAAPVTFQLFRDGTAITNAITPSTWSVPANGHMEWDGTEAYANGETIQGVAGAANSLVLTISGDEVS